MHVTSNVFLNNKIAPRDVSFEKFVIMKLSSDTANLTVKIFLLFFVFQFDVY